MHASESAAVSLDAPFVAQGWPIGDLRGFGRVGANVSLESLALDRTDGGLTPSRPDRPLIGLDVDGDVRWTAAYVPGTNVLETTGLIGRAEIRVVDFMSLAEGRPGQAATVPAGRFVRLVSCTDGEVSMRLVCAASMTAESDTQARTVDGWYVASSQPWVLADGLATVQVRLRAGESMAFVLADHPVTGGATLVTDTLHGLGDTIHFWTWWSDRCRYKGDDFDAVLRQALSLKLACVAGAGMLVEDRHARGFTSAPLGDMARAAALFLEVGYRLECVELLAHLYDHSFQERGNRWSFDERFVETLDRYVLKYGRMGLPVTLKDALADEPDLHDRQARRFG